MNISHKIKHFDQLRKFAIIATPRSGSDYLQSLLDSHPQIITFNGHLALYSNFFTKINFYDQSDNNIKNSIKLFIFKFHSLLNTKNDKRENKNKLGKTKNKFINIPTRKFKEYLFLFLKYKKFNKKNFYLGIYFAYNCCLQKNFKKIKILLLHPHNLDELLKFHIDFKECFYFFTIRHHIAAYYSTINNLSLRFAKYKNLRHSFITFYRSEIDSDLGQKLNLNYICIKLEDLPHKKTLISLCKLMKVNFSNKILTSTFANLKWNGDSISRKMYNDVWTKNRTYNQWREKLSKNEKFLTNILFYKKLKHYKYSYYNINFLDYLNYFIVIFFSNPIRKKIYQFRIFYEKYI